MLGELLATPGVVPIDEVVWTHELELWPRRISDYADAVLATMTHQGSYDSVATFDQRFRRQLLREGLSSFWPQAKPERPADTPKEEENGS